MSRRVSCLPESPEYNSPITNNTSFSLDTYYSRGELSQKTEPNTPSPNSSESSIESLKPDHSQSDNSQDDHLQGDLSHGDEFQLPQTPSSPYYPTQNDFPQSRRDVINRNKKFFRGVLTEERSIVNVSDQEHRLMKSAYSGIVEICCLPSIKKNGFYRMECIEDGRHIKVIDFNDNRLSERYIYPINQLLNLPSVEVFRDATDTNVDIIHGVLNFLRMIEDCHIDYKMRDIVIISGIPICNAYWNGYYLSIGSGNMSPRASQLIKPLCSIDIVAHELGHSLIEEICDLEYRNESGALNESIADILGVCTEYYAFKNIYLSKSLYIEDTKVKWEIGGKIKMEAMRSFSDPHLHGQPKFYKDKFWYYGSDDYGGVHTNSGVLNHWFFRASQLRPILEVMCMIIDALRVSYKRSTIMDFHALLPNLYIDIVE